MSGAGTTFIAPGATATLTSGFGKDLRRDIDNSGTFIVGRRPDRLP